MFIFTPQVSKIIEKFNSSELMGLPWQHEINDMNFKHVCFNNNILPLHCQ